MLVTDPGISTDLSDPHPQNASFPMLVTDPGISTDLSDAHPENASSPMLVAPAGTGKRSVAPGTATSVLPSRLYSAPPLDEYLLFPMPTPMDLSDPHPENAPFPMLVTDLGISTYPSDPHLPNALFPMLVTDPGISTDPSDSHPQNA